MTGHRACAQPVLILGAGINGAAIARELVLNGVGVVVVDRQDLAAGTTSYSSRLIHGGLRYLEYGDFELVRESLAERTRWLRLAPHLVKPLRLFIPVEHRWGGFAAALGTFLGIGERSQQQQSPKRRGLWTIRSGLLMYDRYARDETLGRYQVYRLPSGRSGASGRSDRRLRVPPVDDKKYRWACAYYDAQLCFPERFTLELLVDARQVARAAGVQFDLFTYHRAVVRGEGIDLVAVDRQAAAEQGATVSVSPSAIVNATGAWVDTTLSELGVPSEKLLGGTKGSHFVTFHPELAQLLDRNGIYAEAADGRPVFLLPFGEAVLVGTTDEPFAGDPDTARATPAELQYLMDAVHGVFPQVTLSHADLEVVYSGVRPLPASGPSVPAAITRRHWLAEHAGLGVPCFSVVGGKLTTCRSLAESAAQSILNRLHQASRTTSEERPLPGSAVSQDVTERTVEGEIQRSTLVDDTALAKQFDMPIETIAAVRSLYGERAGAVFLASLNGAQSGQQTENATLLDCTPYPVALARYMVEHEWVRRLDDLIERRLMLLYHRPLTRRCVEQLADVLVAAGVLPAPERNRQIESTIARLQERFQKRVT